MTASTAAPRKLRFGQIVEYTGSLTAEHGYYRVSGSTGPAGSERYELVSYWGRDDGTLRQVRRASIRPVKLVTWVCRECRLEHIGEKGVPRGRCGLAALPEPRPL